MKTLITMILLLTALIAKNSHAETYDQYEADLISQGWVKEEFGFVHPERAELERCINEAMADESGYEVDHYEATEFCKGN